LIVLSGGTGTPKLLLGLKSILKPSELSVVVNTAEDVWISGNLVSPDLDSVLYTLAGIIDQSRWWGIEGDSFHTTEHLKHLGLDETLALGDRDRAVHIFRSELLRQGKTLSSATEALTGALGVKQRVLPMTDDPVATMISTPEGEMHFQEFWVARKGAPDVLSLSFRGLKEADPSPGFMELLEREDEVLIGPSNPVTSIGPILGLRGIREKLREKRIISISPLVGGRPVSGPAAKFMKAMGTQPDDSGVRSLLGCDGSDATFIVSPDSPCLDRCVRQDTLMRTPEDSLRFAKRVLELMRCS
jgi:LPPG:FO 2-phospho-L-lactate transferase